MEQHEEKKIYKSEKEVLLHESEYYSVAQNHRPLQPCSDLDSAATRATDSTRTQWTLQPPTRDEVCAAIKKLRNGRSLDSDRITAELQITRSRPMLNCEAICFVWCTGGEEGRIIDKIIRVTQMIRVRMLIKSAGVRDP